MLMHFTMLKTCLCTQINILKVTKSKIRLDRWMVMKFWELELDL